MRARSHVATLVWFAGMVGVFVGERLIGAGPARWITAAGVAAVALSLGMRALRVQAQRGDADRRSVERTLLALGALGALALALYFVQSDLGAKLLGKPLERSSPRLQVVLAALYPALWLAAALPTILAEMAYASVAAAPRLERGRVRDAALTGLGLAGAIVFAFSATYVASARDRKLDLSYARTARPGEATRKLVRTLDQPVTIALFFPPANEVHDEVATYANDLRAESRLVEVKEYDYAVDPAKAKELGVTGNGTLVVARGTRKESMSFGLELEAAHTQLANLDKEVQKRLLQVARPQRTVYLTVGHGERSLDATGDTDKRATLKDLRDLLQDQGYQVRTLGAAEGLATDVPADAATVMVIAPQKPLLAEEIGALDRYMKRGGRLFLALDPDNGLDEKELLAPIGLRYVPTALANDQVYGRRTFQLSDRANLITGSFSSHPSVTTLGRLGGRAPMVLPGAGYFEELPSRPKGVMVSFTVHAHPQTFNDLDGNFTFVEGPHGEDGKKVLETRRAWELAAAVTWKATPPAAQPKPEAARPDAKKDAKAAATDEGRAVVLADSDAVSDAAIRSYGNPAFVVDGMRWLLGDEAIAGETSSEADVPIAHTRKQDVVWFYSSTFLVPALALVVGYFATRRRRRTRRAAAAPAREVAA